MNDPNVEYVYAVSCHICKREEPMKGNSMVRIRRFSPTRREWSQCHADCLLVAEAEGWELNESAPHKGDTQ